MLHLTFQVGHFFSRFGEVIDVTLVLDSERVLKACAKASELEHVREQHAIWLQMSGAGEHKDRLRLHPHPSTVLLFRTSFGFLNPAMHI